MSFTRAQANEALASVAALLSAGAKAGESLNEVRNGALKTLGIALDALQDTETDEVVLNVPPGGNSEVRYAVFVAPVALTIQAIKSVVPVAVTSDPVATINNRNVSGAADRNPLSAASIAVDGLTPLDVNTHALSATAANLLMAAGDYLIVTVTNDSGDAHAGVSFTVVYKKT